MCELIYIKYLQFSDLQTKNCGNQGLEWGLKSAYLISTEFQHGMMRKFIDLDIKDDAQPLVSNASWTGQSNGVIGTFYNIWYIYGFFCCDGGWWSGCLLLMLVVVVGCLWRSEELTDICEMLTARPRCI